MCLCTQMHECVHWGVHVPRGANRGQKPSFRSQFSVLCDVGRGPAKGLVHTGQVLWGFNSGCQVYIATVSLAKVSLFLSLASRPWRRGLGSPLCGSHSQDFHKVRINGVWLDPWLAGPSPIVKWQWYKWVGHKIQSNTVHLCFPLSQELRRVLTDGVQDCRA